MPLPKEIGELVTGKTYKQGDKEVSMSDLLNQVWDGYEALSKVQKANEELSAERKALKDEVKELKTIKTKLEELTKENESLKANQITDEIKAKLDEYSKKGMSTAIEAEINKLKKDLEILQKDNAEKAQKAIEAEKRKKETDRKLYEKDVYDKLRTSLGNAKITGAQQDDAVNFIEKSGFVQIEESDGTFKHTLTLKENDKPLPANFEQIALHIAKERPYLVSPSGKSGSGIDHTGTTNNSPKKYDSIAEMRSEAARLMAGSTTQ